MLWRVRTTMPDRPGALASLAARCGDSGVNILGLQIFPGIEGVTDEVVLRAPASWGLADVAALVEGAGGRRVSVAACTEHALVDGPTRFLQAVRQVVDEPALVPEILARLLDADAYDAASGAAPGPPADAVLSDVLEASVGLRRVEVRRTAPFTATEHARVAAFADLVTALLGRVAPEGPAGPAAGAPRPGAGAVPTVRLGSLADATGAHRMLRRCSAESLHRRFGAQVGPLDEARAARLVVPDVAALVAAVQGPDGDEVVGLATLTRGPEGTAEVGVLVEDAWQRRGIGARLLSGAARVARAQGFDEVVVHARSAHQPLLATLVAANLRGRIRLHDGVVSVTVPVGALKPLEAAAKEPVAAEPAPVLPTPA